MAGTYTYEQGVVLDQLGAVLIVQGFVGRFYASNDDLYAAALYDANGTGIEALPVTNSVYPPFRADVQTGFLDFGTGIRLPVKSVEYMDAGPQAAAAQRAAEDAAASAAASAQSAAQNGGSTPGTGGGVSDHGQLSGLGDDDHTQYLTAARGDARYDTAAAAATKVATAVSTSSTADRNRTNHSGIQGQSTIDGLLAALVSRPQFVTVTTGAEARPTGSEKVIWVDTRTGTPARPTNMQSSVDIWLSPKAP